MSPLTLFKKTKVGGFLQQSNSCKTQVADSATCHNTGLKWKTTEAVRDAQLKLKQKHSVGEVGGIKQGNKQSDCSLRAGLGYRSSRGADSPSGSKEASKELVDTLDEQYEEELRAKAASMGLQGAWINWTGFIQRDLSWKSVLFGKSELVRFCLGTTYEALVTPSILQG